MAVPRSKHGQDALATLLNFDYGVKAAEGIKLGFFVVGVLLPLAINYEAVLVLAGGQFNFCLPDATQADFCHFGFFRLPIVEVACNLDFSRTGIKSHKNDRIASLAYTVIIRKLFIKSLGSGNGFSFFCFFGFFSLYFLLDRKSVV
jgi:hypothetical protein